MASQRRDILAPGQIYHVFNRSVERRTIFISKREYARMMDIVTYYQYAHRSIRYSQFLSLPEPSQNDIREWYIKKGEKEIDMYAYALMPNHIHFLLRQNTQKGITTFLSNLSNSYAKFFNIRHKRTGALWQRPFKAVRIETEEQLWHVSRYIHLNPVSSYVIELDKLDTYPWTSFPEYIGMNGNKLCDRSMIQSSFKTPEAYRAFVHNHADYARTLEQIKHCSIDREEWV